MSSNKKVDSVVDVTDYQIFVDASNDASTLYNSLDENKKIVVDASAVIFDDSVFFGPIADTCEDALRTLNSRMETSLSNFNTLKSYFDKVSEVYKKGDADASNYILTLDDKNTVGFTKSSSATGVLASVIQNALKYASDSRSTYALGWDKTKDYFYGDCFGFVLACFENVTDLQYNPQTMGGTNPATATSYLVNNGKFTQIPLTSSTTLQPGDILICPTSGAEHAEIYVGDGMLASAPSSRGMYHSYYNFGATYILRYNSGVSSA